MILPVSPHTARGGSGRMILPVSPHTEAQTLQSKAQSRRRTSHRQTSNDALPIIPEGSSPSVQAQDQPKGSSSARPAVQAHDQPVRKSRLCTTGKHSVTECLHVCDSARGELVTSEEAIVVDEKTRPSAPAKPPKDDLGRVWLHPSALVMEGLRLGFHLQSKHGATPAPRHFVPILHAGKPSITCWRSLAQADVSAFSRRLGDDHNVGPILVVFDLQYWPHGVPRDAFKLAIPADVTPSLLASATPSSAHAATEDALPLVDNRPSSYRLVVRQLCGDWVLPGQRGRKPPPAPRGKAISTDNRWSLLTFNSCGPPLVFTWTLSLAASATAWGFLLRFAMVAEGERAMQLSQRSDYYPVIACSFLSATAIQIFVQEGFKVLLITFVSQQYLPRIKALESSPLRSAIQLGVRVLAGFAYAVLRVL